MSSSFRLRYFLGLIPTAQKIEKAWNELFIMRNELKMIENSKELARHNELKLLTQSNAFQNKKREILNLSLKGSTENQILTELAGLEQSKPIKNYFKFQQSSDFNRISKIITGKELERYLELKKIVESPGFIQRKKDVESLHYKGSPEYSLFNEFTKLSKSSEILFYIKCVSSSIYVNYKKIADSRQLARLKELRLKAEDQEFKNQVAFLRNKRRFESTPEFKLENEFHDLEKSKIITTYYQLKKRPELAFFDQWDILLDENFSDPKLSTTLWDTEYYWGSKMAGCSFSQENELQAYTGIKNIEINNKVLSIVTKSEQSEGKIWNPSFGLIPKKFEYSSALLNTGNSFRLKEGVVEAKVRFRAEVGITSAFSLTGSRPFPQIDIFRSGHNCVGVGIIDQQGIGGTNKLIQVKGLDFRNFHIFRLEVFGNLLVWKINNHEVHRELVNRKLGELFLNFTGSLHKTHKGGCLPHHFEIDWVRCLVKK